MLKVLRLLPDKTYNGLELYSYVDSDDSDLKEEEEGEQEDDEGDEEEDEDVAGGDNSTDEDMPLIRLLNKNFRVPIWTRNRITGTENNIEHKEVYRDEEEEEEDLCDKQTPLKKEDAQKKRYLCDKQSLLKREDAQKKRYLYDKQTLLKREDEEKEEEISLEKSIRRLREKFYGKVTVEKAAVLMRRYHNNHDLVCKDIILMKDLNLDAQDRDTLMNDAVVRVQ
ncbi:UNVERIFIED_CONTAM: hypothetical protein FKN15_063119 [Acipenser sinensis]